MPAEVLKMEQDFSANPLGLLGVARAQVEGNSLTGPLQNTFEVEVPANTKALHVSVTNMQLEFGGLDNATPQKLALLWVQVTHKKDGKGNPVDRGRQM